MDTFRQLDQPGNTLGGYVASSNDRFNGVCVKFNPIKGNFVTSIVNITNQVGLLEAKPNVHPYIESFRKGSLDFNKRGLVQL